MKRIDIWEPSKLAAQCIIARLDLDLLAEDDSYRNHIVNLTKSGIGGFCIFNGSPESVEKTILTLQSISEIPMFFAADFENGLPMRLSEGTSFPHAMAIGSTDNSDYALQIGQAIAKEAKQIGINWNFAPVCDINSNKNNPVINIRSFGETKEKVAEFASNFAFGTQEEKILACAKHFPGHGDTETDSHLSLPILNFNNERIFDFEFFPFKKLIETGVKSIMIGHLSVPTLDSSGLPASLSKKIIDILKNDLGFSGLVITDALDMKAISDNYSSGQAAVLSLKAGNDVALMPSNVNEAIEEVTKQIIDDENFKSQVLVSIQKIIKMKRWAGIMPFFAKIDEKPNTYTSHLNSALKIAVDAVKVQGQNSLLPLSEDLNFASVAFLQKENDFQSASRFFTMLAQATENDCDFAYVNSEIEDEDLNGIIEGTKESKILIAAMFYKSVAYHGSISIDDKVLNALNRIRDGKKLILLIFGNPYIKEIIAADITLDMFSDSFASLAASIVKLTGRESLVKI